jgi:hypothetical protein
MRRSTNSLPLIISGLFLLQADAAMRLGGQENDLSLEIGTVDTCSEEFDVEVLVGGLSPEPWVPLTTFGMAWNGDDIDLQAVRMHESTAKAQVELRVSQTPGEAEAVIELGCGVLACGGPIEPAPRQPILVLTFHVTGVFLATDLKLLPDFGQMSHSVIFNRIFDPVRPLLIDGRVCLRRFIRGDVDENGALELTDAVGILSYLFLAGGIAPRCGDIADVTDDGKVDISDPIHLVVYLFQGGPVPSPPVATPGLDLTPDNLGCSEPSACR